METNKVFNKELAVMLVGIFIGMLIAFFNMEMLFITSDEFENREPQTSVTSVNIYDREIKLKNANGNFKAFDNKEKYDRKMTDSKIDPEEIRRSKLIYVSGEPDNIVEYGRDPVSGLPDFVDNADISDFI